MPLYRKELSPGVFYNHLKTDRFKSGYFSINFLLPLAAESAAYYAILPRILCRGCNRYPDQQEISRRLEELYGADIATRNFKRGEMQVVGFALDVLDNDYLPLGESADILADTVDLLRDILLDPCLEGDVFRNEYTESERRNRIDAVRAIVNNKHRYAVSRCQEEMCRYEAAGVSVEGRIEDYESLSTEKLMSYYREMLTSARIEIFYIGGQTEESVEALAAKLMLSFPRKTPLSPETQVIYRAGMLKEVEEEVAAAQGMLAIGFRTGTTMRDKDYLSFVLFNEIYGGSPASKLFMNVRERLSLCYFCYSTADLLKGTMMVVAGIKNENKAVAKAEILLQLREIAEGKIDDSEFLCAKESLSNNYRAISDSPSGLEGWYLRRASVGPATSPEENISALAELTKADVAAVAAKVTPDTVYFLRGLASEEKEVEDEDEE